MKRIQMRSHSCHIWLIACLLWAVVLSLTGCVVPHPSLKEQPQPGQSPLSTFSDAPTVAFCELMNSPERYRDKIVRTRVTVITFPENQYVYDPSCYRKDSLTWLDFSSDEPYKILNEKLSAAHKPGEPNRLYVTALGRFEGPSAEGFGHLGGFKYRFVLTTIEDTKVVSDKIPWPWNLKEAQ
jgi:hypothetical protein